MPAYCSAASPWSAPADLGSAFQSRVDEGFKGASDSAKGTLWNDVLLTSVKHVFDVIREAINSDIITPQFDAVPGFKSMLHMFRWLHLR